MKGIVSIALGSSESLTTLFQVAAACQLYVFSQSEPEIPIKQNKTSLVYSPNACNNGTRPAGSRTESSLPCGCARNLLT